MKPEPLKNKRLWKVKGNMLLYNHQDVASAVELVLECINNAVICEDNYPKLYKKIEKELAKENDCNTIDEWYNKYRIILIKKTFEDVKGGEW